MRFLIFCFGLAFVLVAHGAEILWNTIELRPSGEWNGTTWYALNTPYVSIGAEQMPTGVRFWADSSTYMEFAGCLVMAEIGDVISGTYMESRGQYFYRADFDTGNGESAQTDYSIFLDYGESIILGLSVSYSDAPAETYYGTYYGWFQIGLSEDGVLSVNQSAVGMAAGDSIGVSPISEPNGLLLLLMGTGLLGLRRRKGEEMITEETVSVETLIATPIMKYGD